MWFGHVSHQKHWDILSKIWCAPLSDIAWKGIASLDLNFSKSVSSWDLHSSHIVHRTAFSSGFHVLREKKNKKNGKTNGEGSGESLGYCYVNTWPRIIEVKVTQTLLSNSWSSILWIRIYHCSEDKPRTWGSVVQGGILGITLKGNFIKGSY